MPDPAEIELGRVTSVLRGLGWQVTETQVTAQQLTIRATMPFTTPAAPAPAQPGR